MAKMELFIASKWKNNFMEAVDLKPNHKVYCETSSIIDVSENKFSIEKAKKIINDSKSEEKFWIPLIIFDNKIVVADDEIKIISDGKKEFFLPRGKTNVQIF